MNLEIRSLEPELMDDPALDRDRHARALAGLRRINWVSGASRVLWSEIESLYHALGKGFLRVLDVGCGGGDVPIGLQRRARSAQVTGVSFDGCDISAVAVETARSNNTRSRLPGIRFFEHDILARDLPDSYDVVTCSLFLHHFDDAGAEMLARRMTAAARHLVLIDDLRRTRRGYALAWVGCRILSRSPVVRHDGPLSVARAFTPAEAHRIATAAGLGDVRMRLHWPQRFLVVGRPS